MKKFLVATAFTGLALFAQSVPPVDVKVSIQPLQGSTIYHYRVINNSTAPLTGIMIGFEYYHGQPELATFPFGATPEDGIPSTSVTSPAGWAAKIVPTEGTNALDLEWGVDDPNNAIPPGQTLAGFSITVPGSDPTYANSHWTASFNGGSNAALSWTLSQEALCSTPRISVAAIPNVLWPPNHKLMPVTVNVTVRDDSDPNPVLTLQSITANETLGAGDVVAQIGSSAKTFSLKSERLGNEKGGRIYTITYSVKNSCGMSATASTLVTVPHDQR